MIDPQQINSHNAMQQHPIMHHPECLSLRAGSCSFLLDVQELQSHLCASVKELQIDHLQEKYTEQVFEFCVEFKVVTSPFFMTNKTKLNLSK